jgi:hypothetical protein
MGQAGHVRPLFLAKSAVTRTHGLTKVASNVGCWHHPDMGAHRNRVRLVVLTGSFQTFRTA